MLQKTKAAMGSRAGVRSGRLLGAALMMLVPVGAQEAPLAWDQVKNFRYNLVLVNYDAGSRVVKVALSVTNPAAGNAPYELLGTGVAPAFKPPATLRVLVSWNAGNWGSGELVNTKDVLTPVVRTVSATGVVTGVAPAPAATVNVLAATTKRCSEAGSPCGGVANAALTYWVQYTLPVVASGAGRVGIEGHPSVQTGVDPVTGAAVFASVPAKSVYQDFVISGSGARRAVVDFNKCKVCHDGAKHGDTVVPRLSLHGANRNEEPGVCVTCHNANQTDAAYRTTGVEESVDFKRMVHGIHAGDERKNALVIIGRNGSVNDYSHVKFPAALRNCVLCHIDDGKKGTFELPMASTLGSTVKTWSVLTGGVGQIDVDPANDLRISPIAATCSGCHDDRETREHMTRMGASFGVVQSALAGKEQCATCHGPGKSKDVRKEHEIRSRTSGSRER